MTTPKNQHLPEPKNDLPESDLFRPIPNIDIEKHHNRIIESNDTIMQAPDAWPPAPDDDENGNEAGG
ncbi:MAG: hypothetical protein JNK97_07430 [Zoogloea sp.]|nr:hypothetical protein [Zoogloea sp.]